jgi:arylsulfatase A-like enzyme
MPRLASLSLLLSAALPAPLAAQGNVLLVVADDLGVDKVACYGEGSAPPPTPTLDVLAASGVRFQRCIGNPVCSPTRATIQTGRYSFRTGVGTVFPAGPPLVLAERTLPEALGLLGSPHTAGAFGKWHLGGNAFNPTTAKHPNLQGYDRYAGALGGALTNPYSYFSWPRTVDGVTQISSTYATTANVDDALAWIGAQEGPWFVYLAFNAGHRPFHAPPPELHTQVLPGGTPCLDPVPFYNAMIEAMDRELGRLLASLSPAAFSTTTVIFVGDNGTSRDVSLPPEDADHGKGTLYQGGIRVPLIVSGPGVAEPGRSETALVNTTDLFATVLELCGADPAALPGGAPPDSISLLPYLADPLQPDLRTQAFAEAFQGGGLGPPTTPPTGACVPVAELTALGKTLCNDAFKLIRFEDGREELYHLAVDPNETSDLLAQPALDPEEAAAYAELSAGLAALLGS